MFANYGTSDHVEAKGIENLLKEFSVNTNTFKDNMRSIDVSERLKNNNARNRLED